jgi:multidrug efflux system outer membrane protein
MKKRHYGLFVLLPLLLAACATPQPPSTIAAAVPQQWHARLPPATTALAHEGASSALAQWWRRQGDPLLAELIESAQAASPTIVSAKSRIEQSRATRVAAGAALLPVLDASASTSRSNTQPPLPLGTMLQAALQPAWEIDLFGAGRNRLDAAQARLEGAQAGWHEARVAVAAEVADQYYGLRACRTSLDIIAADAASRAETARLTTLTAKAGFQAPATAALARATAAEGSSRVIQQRAQCDVAVKGLVALTALPEPALRQRLDAARTDLPENMGMPIAALPAQILAQRPDIFNAERAVAAASAEVGSAEALRYPRLALSGSIGLASFRAGGASTDLSTWSIGPLALTVPLFDGGQRAANVDAARARYEEAAANYRALVRQAVREVEEALVTLDSVAARNADARAAVEGYRESFSAIEDRYTNGFASLIEVEEVRRPRLAAEIGLVSLQRERVAAWVALYRAAGGGWSPNNFVAGTHAATLK